MTGSYVEHHLVQQGYFLKEIMPPMQALDKASTLTIDNILAYSETLDSDLDFEDMTSIYTTLKGLHQSHHGS